MRATYQWLFLHSDSLQDGIHPKTGTIHSRSAMVGIPVRTRRNASRAARALPYVHDAGPGNRFSMSVAQTVSRSGSLFLEDELRERREKTSGMTIGFDATG